MPLKKSLFFKRGNHLIYDILPDTEAFRFFRPGVDRVLDPFQDHFRLGPGQAIVRDRCESQTHVW
jgi:hypothetical protein